MSDVLASRVFTEEDQDFFAEVSGDWNEIHVDPAAARRSVGGEQVVHGMHSVMWAMNTYFSKAPSGLGTLSVTFRKPVHLDEEVELHVRENEESRVKLSVVKGHARLIDIQIGLTEPLHFESPDDREQVDFPAEPRELTIEEIAGREGELKVPVTPSLESVFPKLAGALGPATTAQLAAISRLVGMICPGRYSLLSGVELSVDPRGSAKGISWRVVRADPRVAAVTIALTNGRIGGSVNAFVRPSPTVQPDMAAVSAEIRPHEFEGQRALVVGGSRGLGELTAKMLAAGGADVVITWLYSKAESQKVAAEIRSSGRVASHKQLDASDPGPAIRELSAQGWQPTHLYYYATPPIFVRRTGLYDSLLFDRFADIYVDGFARVIEACRREGASHLTAFFPSSVAVEEAIEGLLEYAAAKAAGEVAARTMGAANTWLDVVVRRLPRLPTDQTATFMPVPTENPVAVMAEVLRHVSAVKPKPDPDDRHSE